MFPLPFPWLSIFNKGAPYIRCANISLRNGPAYTAQGEVGFIGVCDCSLALIVFSSVGMGEDLID